MATVADRLLQKSAGAPSAATREEGKAGQGVLAGLGRLLAAERDQWPLLVPVALGAGVAAWFLLPFVAQRQAALAAGLGMALLGLAAGGQARAWLVGAGLLFATGLAVAEWRSLSVAAPVLHHRVVSAELTGLVEAVAPRRGSAEVRIRLRRDGDGARFDISAPAASAADVAPGARVALVATLEPRRLPILPGGFDSGRRAWFEGVSATGRARGPVRVLEPPEAPAPALWLGGLRTAIDRYLLSTLGPERGGVASALVTGGQGGIPEALRSAMQLAGLAHLLTVSGFHIGVAAGAAFLLARRLLALTPAARRRSLRAEAALAGIVAAWAYVLLSGAQVPAVRAGITASFVLLALALGRDPFSLRLVALAATLVLLIRPESLVSASFQLSFAAVTALVLLASSAWFRRWLAPADDDWPVRWAKRVGALFVSSLVAELVLSPIAAAHFGRAGVYGVAANMAAIPLTSLLVMPLVALHLLAGLLGLEALTAPLAGAAIDALAGIATRVAALPASSVEVARVGLLPFALGISGAILLGLLAGPLRWLGLPLLLAAPVVHLVAPRPDLFVAADARQIGLVSPDGTLFLGRGTGRSFTARSWAEAAAAPAVRPLREWPGARCGALGCLVEARPGTVLLFVRAEEVTDEPALAALCARADLVIGPSLPRSCRPRWQALDRDWLVRKGPLAITLATRRIRAQADIAGDHPWSPAALPGRQERLIGGSRWTEPLAE
ncbi:ComEC/Rec2 family competence protein [Thermaurantiacus tibetensis]|uniref:ComEC/Rec2 family competence protein n=1 Tax=Thermaurantiacus tibetensis TaxID=2759035 RepID=UPI00188EE0C1|nr:ComEC/Rec2 family competence protein [Thermaurantiacus tibetensis]